MKKKLSPTVFLAQAAMIAALYIVLTFIANALGLAIMPFRSVSH